MGEGTATTPATTRVLVQEADFDIGAELAAMRDRTGGRAGAIASFVGLVRDVGTSAGTLRLEHYPGMTERSMAQVVDAAVSRWPLLDVLVIHRVGELVPAEQIVLVLVASAHRAAAFDACEYLMDYLKTEAVLWKYQGAADAGHWIESTAEDHERARRWRDGDR